MLKEQEAMKESKRTDRTVPINLLVTKEELAEIRSNAKKFAGGNVSAWIRYAARKLLPRKEDLVK